MTGLLVIIVGSMVGLAGLHAMGFMIIVCGFFLWMFADD